MGLGYVTAGSGEHKVLALHGWFGDHTTYDPMRDALGIDAFTYAFPAYRGYGLSKGQRGDYSIAEMAADALGVADALGWDRFSILAHSMSGMVAQRLLLDAPGRVRRIAAVAPVPASGMPFDVHVWALFEGAARNIDNRRTILAVSTGNRLGRPWIDRMARYSAETSAVEAFAAYLPAWARTDFHHEVEGNPAPIKVIVGEHDLAVTAEGMRETYLAWYPNAELEVMPNAGHYPMNETPVALAASVEAFLARDGEDAAAP